ncbi:MAG TPA: PIG-L family deacetylase [Longimicrobiaceae bacterium]|nr:PIG-L family deacetylase [Longimicrobiaceae bacterium]
MRVRLPLLLVPALLAGLTPALARAQESSTPRRIVLAVGGHAGDMEISAGAALLKAARQGDRVVILHMTLGEGGNPKLTPEQYGAQKRREALVVDSLLGAEAIFGPYEDGQVPNDEQARRYVADVIRQVKPTLVITHWKKSIHKDHSNTSAVVQDAVLLASLPGVETGHPAWRGVRGIWYAENWEDPDGFDPYLYVDVTDEVKDWREAVRHYEFIGGTVSSFPYLSYYTALATLRGAEARKGAAVAFDIDPMGKKRILSEMP